MRCSHAEIGGPTNRSSSTTDPADHLDFFKTADPAVTINRDEQQVLKDYQAEVLAARQTMKAADVDYVAEDRSHVRRNCGFRAFANVVAQNGSDVVVIDTANWAHVVTIRFHSKAMHRKLSAQPVTCHKQLLIYCHGCGYNKPRS